MKYKVQIGFLTSENRVVSPGIYDSSEIDLAEARKKSIVTVVGASDFVESVASTDDTVKTKIFNSQPQEIGTKFLEPKVEIKRVKALKINSANVKEIEDVKFIGKKTAESVVKERVDKPFKNYVDLDTRIPLRGGRKWQDIVAVDFEFSFKQTIENTVEFRD